MQLTIRLDRDRLYGACRRVLRAPGKAFMTWREDADQVANTTDWRTRGVPRGTRSASVAGAACPARLQSWPGTRMDDREGGGVARRGDPRTPRGTGAADRALGTFGGDHRDGVGISTDIGGLGWLPRGSARSDSTMRERAEHATRSARQGHAAAFPPSARMPLSRMPLS